MILEYYYARELKTFAWVSGGQVKIRFLASVDFEIWMLTRDRHVGVGRSTLYIINGYKSALSTNARILNI